MIPGTRLLFKPDLSIGTYVDTVFAQSVWWYLVKWDSGRSSLVNPSSVSITHENLDNIYKIWGLL